MNPDGMAGQGGLTGESYRFDDIVVDAAAHTLSRAGQEQTVEPKAFAVLLILLRRAGELVGRDELLDEVWGHRHVTPGVLTRVIAQLRSALGDDSQRPRFIQTQHALGYRFIAQIRPAEVEPEPEASHEPAPVAGEHATEVPEVVAAVRQSVPPAFTVAANEPEPVVLAVAPVEASRPVPHASPRRRQMWLSAMALLLAIAAGGYWFGQRSRSAPPLADASIAVLPFTSLSADRGDGYFAEGLGVEMHDALAGVPGLKVVTAARGGSVDVKALGAQLGVATLLDASVRREGTRVRVSARLSDTRTGFTLWAHSYDRESSDVFALQSDIANEVVQSLVGVLPGTGLAGAREAMARRLTPTRDIAAYDAYLKGQQQIRAGDRAAADSAINFFRGALAIDPRFARAQAGICRAEIARFEDARDTPAFDRAQAACDRAAKMDPSVREVSLALGDLYRTRSDADKAFEHYTRALEDPALRPDAYIGLAKVASAQGRSDVALDYFERARKLAPNDPRLFRERGFHYYANGDLPAAIASLRTTVTLRPDDYRSWSSLGGLYQANGDIAQAMAAFERSLKIKPNYPALSNLGTIKFNAGDYAEAADLYRHAYELDRSDFRLLGNVGDALSADPATASQAREYYQRAADLAEPYLRIKPDDAQGLAELAWYRANLDEHAQARSLLAKAESLAIERGEVALWGAQTLAMLGDLDGARRQVAIARSEGIPDQRIDALPVLKQKLAPAASSAPAKGR